LWESSTRVLADAKVFLECGRHHPDDIRLHINRINQANHLIEQLQRASDSRVEDDEQFQVWLDEMRNIANILRGHVGEAMPRYRRNEQLSTLAPQETWFDDVCIGFLGCLSELL
jgi:hypothetical protein